MVKTYRLKVHYRNGTTRIVPETFDSQKKARAYAIRWMDVQRDISSFTMSNPDYADIWQVASRIERTDDGRGYYWSALYGYAGWQKGSGHYINKDGSLSKKAYMYYAKDW